jgi:acyl-CoA thioesterase FadM
MALDAAPADDAVLLLTRRFHVTMSDVDATTALYYASPMLWAGRMLTDWRLESGRPVSAMLASGQGTPVVRAEVTYTRPMRLDDEVEATMWFLERSRRTFTLACRFALGPGGPIGAEVRIVQTAVAVGEDGAFRSTELPADLVAGLEGSVA